MATWLLLIVLSLVVYRATRLIVRDDFPPIRWGRNKINMRGPEWLSDLVSCHWCASGWVALVTVVLADLVTSVPLPVAMWFATWGVGAWLIHHEK